MYRTGDARARDCRRTRCRFSGGSIIRSSCAASASNSARSNRPFVGEDRTSTEVAVVLREESPGDRRLACYYVETPRRRTRRRRAARARSPTTLPDYMIPPPGCALERDAAVGRRQDRPQGAAGSRIGLERRPIRAPATPTEISLRESGRKCCAWSASASTTISSRSAATRFSSSRSRREPIGSGLRLEAKELLRQPTLAALARLAR